MRDGFERLDDAGIQVFVVPGPSDPLAVWDDFPDMPSNVTVFRPESDDPVAVLRDGAVIASIRALAWQKSWFVGEDAPQSNSNHLLRGTRATRGFDDELPFADLSQRRAKEADEAETWGDADDAHDESLVDDSDDPELDEGFEADGSPLDAATTEKHEAHREIRRVESAADLRPNHFAIAHIRQSVGSFH